MPSVDDVRAIPLFSALSEVELDRLALSGADVHLGAGEYAVHEGGGRALYAGIVGKIEVVKRVDGIERTLGWRIPGAIFGEVRSSPIKRVASAVGEGSMAIAFVHQYLQKESPSRPQ